MKYSTLMATTAMAISLGLAGAALADSNSTGGGGNSGANSGNSSNAINTNLTAVLTKTDTVAVNKDNTSVGGDFTIAAPKAETNQELKGVVVGNSFNLQPAQAAAASAAASAGNGGTGGSGLVGGGTGGGGGAGGASAAAAGSTGQQPIYTGSISMDGAAMQNFAGIETASFNTGIGSNALAASGVTANANVTFGSSNVGTHP